MKKLLALVLALVMTLSLCTISNAAYSDAADVDYKEAVDVMSAVGVFQGADGKFSPKANLTREQAAKLIAYLDLGETTAEALPALKVFSDVEADRWSSKYIAYCADAGIIAGVGDNKFNPTGELTGYAFAKMLFCVLGYDQTADGLTGSNWMINVAKLLASDRKLAKGVDGAASAVLTREQAAQYCLNTLKNKTVTAHTGTTTTVNGITVTSGGSKATTEVSNDYFYKKYDTLTYAAAASGDDFGRTAMTWTYKTKTVGTYTTVDADYTFVSAKAYAAAASDATVLKAMQDLTGNSKLSIVSGTTFKLNGDTVAANSRAFAIGDTVEIYLTENTNNIANIVVTRYTLTKLSAAKAAAGAKDSDGNVYAYTLDDAAGEAITGTPNTQFPGYDAETYKKDAVIAVAVNAADKVLASYVPTYTTGAISAYTDNANVTLGGTKYNFVASAYNPDIIAAANVDWKNGEYGVYTDVNGYALGIKVVSATTALTDVYYVNGVWTENKTAYGAASTKVYAQAVALDGTIEEFEIGFDAGTVLSSGASTTGYYTKAGNVYTAAVSTADGTSKYYKPTAAVGDLVSFKMNDTTKVYDVSDYTSNSTYYVAEGQTQTLTSKSTKTSTAPFSSKAAYLTADTQYVVLEKDGKDLKATVLTGGVSITSESTAVIATKDANGNYVAEYVVVDLAAAYSGTVSYDELLYVKTASSTVNGSGTYAVEVYDLKGEKTTITATSAGADNTFYTYSLNSKGNYVLAPVTTSRADNLTTGAWDKDKKGVAYDETFTSLYGTKVTFGSYVDVEMANVVVVDLHDNTAAGAYTGVVSSLSDIYAASETIKTAPSTKYVVTFDVNVDANGGVILFVTSIN